MPTKPPLMFWNISESASFCESNVFKWQILKNFRNSWRCNSVEVNRLQHRCFPLKFAKFLRVPFIKEYHRWMHLKFCLNNKSALSLKRLIIWKHARKQTQELFCKGGVPRILWKLLHIETSSCWFNLLDGNEKNIFAIRAVS